MNYTCKIETPLGTAYALSDGAALTGLRYKKGPYPAAEDNELPVFTALRNWLAEYFAGKNPETVLPLSVSGTAFRLEIWDMLCEIPYSKTVTYGKLAKAYAELHGLSKMSAQAVGGAVGANPVSIIIPCHRVIGADGKLVGYGEGLDRKAALLKLENPSAALWRID
ncbi:MAG: methylated-DNA--[protein]-cysteine S-methyltransferase [Clostridia bacterium]|nr:methylated-DNA--[protein]-cysteine S-methyltransferase [Clostridia bacterium]